MKNLVSACGFLAIVSSSLPGNAPAATAQSCNYYAGISVTGQKVNLDTCSISKSSGGTNFVYYLGDKKLASKANCSDRTWTTSSNSQVNTPQSQATKKMLDRVCNEQISSNFSSRETQESNTEDRSIAQANDRVYEDDLIRARGLSAAFEKANTIDSATVNVLIENKSKKDIFLASTYGGTGTVVTSDSGQSSTCGYTKGIKAARASEKESSNFSRLKPGGKITISGVRCDGLDPSSTKVVSFNIDLTMWEKEKNSQLTLSLTGIPVKKISTR
jgi:hypothetical protein